MSQAGRKFSLLACLALFSLILLVPSAAWAQRDTGSIAGTVKDPSGAVVPGATVTVTNMNTGANFSTKTDASGEFVASPLLIGQYRVTVAKHGFKTTVVGPFSIQIQQRAAVDVTLEVGQTVQTIQVHAATPVLETQTSSLGQVVNNQEVVDLPLNGRNFAQLALLTAGTAPAEPGSRDQAGYGFSANGGRSLQNNFLLNGMDNNSNLTDLLNESNYVVGPPVDAIQEFKVQTNSYSAQFGRGNGAIINVSIKQGTNQLHGDLWEFLRNDKLDARNFFDQTRPAYQQNQFGFTLGGPVDIPHLYNGKDKTFFFGDFERLLIRQGQTDTSVVPTAAQRAGDFSSQLDLTSPVTVGGQPVLDCNGNPTYSGEIFNTRLTQNDPNSPTGLCGVPFMTTSAGVPINQIPAGVQDSLAARLINLYPVSNANQPGYNFISNPKNQVNRSNFDARLDHIFSAKDTSFFVLDRQQQPSILPGPFGGLADGSGFFNGVELNTGYNSTASETHIFSPTLINEFRAGYNRLESERSQFNANTNVSAQLGFPGVPYVPGIGGLPQLTFSDASTLGSATYLPSDEIQNTIGLTDSLTWIHGKHTVQFGGEVRHEEFTIYQPAAPRGSLDFGPSFTDNPAAPGTGGTGMASFLLGLSDGGSINNLHDIDYLRKDYAGYVEDTYRMTPRVTLNLGLRYDFFGTVQERFNAQGTFNFLTDTLIIPMDAVTKDHQPSSLTPLLSSIIPVSPTGSRGLIQPDYNNFAPRAGLAVKLTNKLVLRTGYGIFYGGEENGPYSNPSQGFNPPFFVTQSFSNPCGAASANPASLDCSLPGIPTLSDGFPANALVDPNTPSLFSIDPHLATPYMQDWNFGLQYQLPGNTLLEVAYAGSKGTRLYDFLNGNQATPTANPNLPTAPRRPFPAVDSYIALFSSDAISSYNSLQTKVQKNFSHGFSFLATYTWAHSMDNTSSANLGAQNGGDFRYFQDRHIEFANSDFDVRNRAVISGVWQLPFGQGKAFAGNASGVMNQLVGGWQVASIASFSNGNWFTITDSNGNFANSDGQQRPNQIGNPNASPCQPNTFFNTCAFVDPSLGSSGSAGRNTVAGPGFYNLDFSLFKEFRTSEHTHLEFRSEFFNLLNHPNLLPAQAGPQFGINTTSLGSPEFGFLTAAQAPREIQFALKFFF